MDPFPVAAPQCRPPVQRSLPRVGDNYKERQTVSYESDCEDDLVPQHAGDQQADERAAFLDNLEAELSSLGVSLSNTDEEIRQAIENARQYAQTATVRRGSETLRKYGIDPSKKYNTRDVAAALEARQRQKYGTIERGDYSEEASKRIASWMVEEVMFEVEQAEKNPAKSAVGWYSTKFRRALDALAVAFPEFVGEEEAFGDESLPGLAVLGNSKNARDFFTALMAITSDGAKVADNFRFASAAYETFRQTGRVETEVTFGGERNKSMRLNLQNIQETLDAVGADRMAEFLLAKDTASNLNKIAKAEGKEFAVAYKADDLELAAVYPPFGSRLEFATLIREGWADCHLFSKRPCGRAQCIEKIKFFICAHLVRQGGDTLIDGLQQAFEHAAHDDDFCVGTIKRLFRVGVVDGRLHGSLLRLRLRLQLFNNRFLIWSISGT
jgi:hypothetical protein